MNKQFTWKFSAILAVALLAIYAFLTNGIKQGIDLKGGTSYLLKMDLSQIDSAGHDQAVQQATDIIERRLNKFGVSEPVIQRVGEDRILVQLPGLKESDRLEARDTIEQTAYLEFRLVKADNDDLQASASDPRFVPPLGFTNLTEAVKNADGHQTVRHFYVKLRPEQGLTGKYVKRAAISYNEVGQPGISLEFTDAGAEIFRRVTAANVGRQLAIILDGEVQSAPRINEEIPSGRAQISGDFTLTDAQRLSSVLENPLQAPVKVLEERSVDPTLGKDSIASGMHAAIYGALAVVIFMAGYYLLAGLVADLALAFNILITIGVLAMFKFTLTLPGIAGVVLTIGMAVDTNVLIYERVREELAANKPMRAALAAGYSRAFRVIFDAHFTAILTAIILIVMGSGPVKGFGVTLVIGLLANLFSGVFVTRFIFDWLLAKGVLKSFKMCHIFKKVAHINFLGVWKIAFILSWLLIGAGMYRFVARGGLDVGRGEVYGIDFKGGDTSTLSFDQKVNDEDIRKMLNDHHFTEAYIQYQRPISGGTELLEIKLPEGKAEAVTTQLKESFPAAGFKVLGTEHVGAVIGKELLQQALIAVAVSLIAIMVYIALRFGELSYGLGALISLIHDVLMTVGWFCLTGRTFSMPVVAAILTLIGYSINDTIVVFDRIRETKKLSSTKVSYFDLINRSVNETLSRTILTAGTVFLTAVSLYVFGGRVLNDFAFCFLVGVLTGTYSSIYIASPVVLWYHRREGQNAARSAVPKAVQARA